MWVFHSCQQPVPRVGVACAGWSSMAYLTLTASRQPIHEITSITFGCNKMVYVCNKRWYNLGGRLALLCQGPYGCRGRLAILGHVTGGGLERFAPLPPPTQARVIKPTPPNHPAKNSQGRQGDGIFRIIPELFRLFSFSSVFLCLSL